VRGGKLGFWYRLAVVLLKPPVIALTRRDWRGGEHIPRRGGVVVVPNHVSYADPIAVAHFLYDLDRPPRFLAKDSMFRVPFVGQVLSGAQQIPVFRESKDAQKAFSAAVDAVRAGECVVVYAEATLTRDPDLWPMAGKTGAARIALSTGCPVIPLANWGPQDLLRPYAKRPRLWPRRTLRVLAGPPVDLSAWEGRELTPEVLKEATDRILDDVTALLEQLRGEKAPAVRFDARAAGLPRTGRFDRRSM
jgi:1-acyl-sn-glycerol-3-phosphate acyltransferase